MLNVTRTQLNIKCMPKVYLSKTISFQILPTWLDSCLWWVFQMSTLFANHLILKKKLNSIFLLLNVFFLELNQLSVKGELKAYGAITYDSTANKLRFRSNESQPTNGSLGLDLLMFFNEVQFTFPPCHIFFSQPWNLTMLWQGIFYEIDSKNESCEKKKLHCSMHPLDIPDGAKFHGLMNAGNPSINGEGLKINTWTGQMPDVKGRRGALRGCYIIVVTLTFCSFVRLLQHLCNHGMFAC